jgi:protein TonB
MADNINYASASMDDIVFEGRNKSYGAYELRKIYSKYASRGLIIAVLSFVAFVLLAQVDYSFLKKKKSETEISVETTDVDLPKDQPLDPTKPPPPPPPPPPQAPQMKFVEMVVKKDEQVADDDVHSQEELQEPKQISNQDKEGDENAKFVAKDPEQPVGNGPVVSIPTPVVEETKEDEIFTIVEDKPLFPGGQAELMKYLAKNIRYPDFAKENQIKGTCALEFVVEKDGSITDIKVLKDIGGGCGEEAVRVIKSMPKWEPGKQRGKPVRVKYTLPVQFRLQ